MAPDNVHNKAYTYFEEAPQERPSNGSFLNLVLILAVLVVGFFQLEQDWTWYKSELLIFHSVQDGLAPEDMPKLDMAAHLRSQMKYKDASQSEFFVAKWLPKLPIYLFAFLLPFVLGMIRIRRGSGGRFGKWYFVFYGIFIAYSLYFFSQYFSLI